MPTGDAATAASASGTETGTRTALVTGASRGIGHELTRLFAADGYDVVLVSRDEERLETVATELEAEYGVACHVFTADLTTAAAAQDLYERVTEAGHEVDALANNAGYGSYGPFVETDLETDLDLIGLHVTAVTVLTKLFGREMAARGHGHVLTTASVAGLVPVPTSTVYSAAKHYARSFSEALAEEFAGTDVTVTALCPGPTRTGFFERGGFESSGYGTKGMMDAATVAEVGYEALMDGERLAVPGLMNKLKLFVGRFLPRKLYVRAAQRVHEDGG